LRRERRPALRSRIPHSRGAESRPGDVRDPASRYRKIEENVRRSIRGQRMRGFHALVMPLTIRFYWTQSRNNPPIETQFRNN
jgi:hypothetical protein